MEKQQFLEKEFQIPGLKNTYRILHITDSHIVMMGHREEGYIIKGGPHMGKKLTDFGDVRYEHFSRNGITSAQRFASLCDQIGANPTCADAIVFTGDILDFFTESAFDFMCENLKKIPIPYLFTLGNHDMIFSKMSDDQVRSKFTQLCGGNTEVQKLKLGELALIGIDNTRNYYSQQALLDLDQAMEGEEQVLLFQHIPLSTKEYHQMKVDLGEKDYALGNQGICEGDSWKVLFQKIEAPDSPIRALICGDCHVDHLSPLGNAVQFTSPFNASFPPVLFVVHG